SDPLDCSSIRFDIEATAGSDGHSSYVTTSFFACCYNCFYNVSRLEPFNFFIPWFGAGSRKTVFVWSAHLPAAVAHGLYG
ncbi:MAG TPA: hypothetical protein VJ936_07105, partial [Desulfobacteraceae bacterium]|nr:hypothetical protein [Desulfobacteraceae bacterium]